MQRFVLFAVLMVCLACFYQAAAQEAVEEAAGPTDLDNVKKTIQDTVSTIEKKAKEMMESMDVQRTIDSFNMGDTLDNFKQMFENAAAKLQEEAAKLMKNDK